MKFIRSLGIQGLLSFPPDMPPFELHDLNVLIGPNGSGKSNIIEAIDLLRATPTDFAGVIREGGGAAEWLWKGETVRRVAKMEVETEETSIGLTTPAQQSLRLPGVDVIAHQAVAGIGLTTPAQQSLRHHTGLTTPTQRALRYRLEFTTDNMRVEVVDEAIEDTEPWPGHDHPYFYYRFQRGNPAVNIRDRIEGDRWEKSPRRIKRYEMLPDQSVLAQIRDPQLYPELTWLGRQFGQVQLLRDWTFGRYTAPRQAQPADLPEDRLLPDCRNLALILNKIEQNQVWLEFNRLLKRFFPRFERMSTMVSSGRVQFYLHESGFRSPVPATRLSDGTIRFVALLATLLTPSPPPLVCIDEPELGLHPDAVSLVADLIVDASERMQLIVATHSDALVSALTGKTETVVACERIGAGTTLRRLDSAKLADWLKDYALGDLWRMGELGANP